jgi:hypothetical protein
MPVRLEKMSGGDRLAFSFVEGLRKSQVFT